MSPAIAAQRLRRVRDWNWSSMAMRCAGKLAARASKACGSQQLGGSLSNSRCVFQRMLVVSSSDSHISSNLSNSSSSLTSTSSAVSSKSYQSVHFQGQRRTLFVQTEPTGKPVMEARSSAVDAPQLTRFTLRPPNSVEVEFADGNSFNLSAEFLRVHSPAADSKIRSIGREKVIFGRSHVGIMCAEPIGNYGVRLVFDDLHKTGIYTWEYLYQLGTNKFTLMRNYIKTLRKHGLTRDPSRK